MSPSSNPVALVTGGGVGIGREVARSLAVAGYDVAITYHSHSAADVVESIKETGGRAIALRVDATKPTEVGAATEQVSFEFGRLDLLVNNVGGLISRASIASMATEHWHQVMNVNMSSTFYFTRAAIPLMKVGGRIVNISSLAGQSGGGDGASAYAASKAAMLGFTRAAARELGAAGITVNAITPGYINDTPFHATFSTDEAQAGMIAASAVKRAGVPADVSAVVAFLASEGASFVTGAVIDLNGGAYFSQ